MTMHHLKRYATEVEQEAIFDISHMCGQDWCWFYIKKIQALKAQKITWPDDNFEDTIWAISVDGTHCWIEEPQHPTLLQNPSFFLHKFAKAGLDYKLGISLTESQLVWMNVPFKAGTKMLLFLQNMVF